MNFGRIGTLKVGALGRAASVSALFFLWTLYQEPGAYAIGPKTLGSL